MGLVDRIERKLESTVGDAFARVFGGSIVPQEVEAMLRRIREVEAAAAPPTKESANSANPNPPSSPPEGKGGAPP